MNLKPMNQRFLSEQLSLLRPLKEKNILILGETGVGKSTWINACYNLINFETLDEAVLA